MSPNPKVDRYERGTYLGGHEISAISGMNPYMTAADVFANVALGDREDISEKPVIRRGLIIEPGFITWLEATWGIKVDRDLFFKDPDVPYFGGTVDALERKQIDGKEVRIIHEMTSCTTRTLELWSKHEPAKYKWVQCQFYMDLADADYGWIHLFITDTGEIRHYKIERKPDANEAFREEAEEFWLDHIMTKIPPSIDVNAYSGELGDEMMKRIYPQASAGDMSADSALVDLCFDYIKARDAAKAAEDKKKKLSAELKSALGANEKAVFDKGYVSWKNTADRTSTNWQMMARDLMQTMPDEERALVIGNFTQTKPGSRTLRVQIKKEKKT